MLAKPEPHKRVKARRQRAIAKARAECRRTVLVRDRHRCVRCDRSVSDELPEWHPHRAHVNERVPRSKGGNPLDPNNCELLCGDCHMPNGRHAPTPERLAILTGRQKGKA